MIPKVFPGGWSLGGSSGDSVPHFLAAAGVGFLAAGAGALAAVVAGFLAAVEAGFFAAVAEGLLLGTSRECSFGGGRGGGCVRPFGTGGRLCRLSSVARFVLVLSTGSGAVSSPSPKRGLAKAIQMVIANTFLTIMLPPT